jgi:hypothetical protein
MSNNFFHIQNELKSRVDTAVNNTVQRNDSNSYHAELHSEIRGLAYKLPNLLSMDTITKHTVIPWHTEFNITPTFGQGPLLSPYKVQITLHYQDFLEEILHPDYFNQIQPAVQPKPVAQVTPVKQDVVVDRSNTTIKLPNMIGPVRQEPGSYDCVYANLEWCTKYFGGDKKHDIDFFRKRFSTLYPKDQYGGITKPQQLYTIISKDFTYGGVFSQEDYAKAIEAGHPLLIYGKFPTPFGNAKDRKHCLVITGLTFDKNGKISYYQINDPDREEPISRLSAKDMAAECELTIVITGLVKP